MLIVTGDDVVDLNASLTPGIALSTVLEADLRTVGSSPTVYSASWPARSQRVFVLAVSPSIVNALASPVDFEARTSDCTPLSVTTVADMSRLAALIRAAASVIDVFGVRM